MILLLALPDLLTPVVVDQAESTILTLAKQVGLPVTAWRKGGVALAIVRLMALAYALIAQVIAQAIGGGFLDYATGKWLTLLAKQVFFVDRLEATFAPGKLTLTNTGDLLFIFEAGDVTAKNPSTGKTYRSTSGGTLLPGGTLDLDIIAQEVGSGSTSAPNTITELVTVFDGVTCTNAGAVVGVDEEIDEDLRTRCRLKPASLSPNGPKKAYEYFARSARRLADNSPIGVNRIQIPTPPGDGSLEVYVATPTGGVTGTVGDTTTDLGKIDDDIQNNVVPEGVGPVDVKSAVDVLVPITYTVWVDSKANLTDLEVKAAIETKLAKYFPTVPISGHVIPPATGKLYRNALVGTIERPVKGVDEVVSEAIIKAEVSLPAADVDLAVGEDAKLSTITATVVQV